MVFQAIEFTITHLLPFSSPSPLKQEDLSDILQRYVADYFTNTYLRHVEVRDCGNLDLNVNLRCMRKEKPSYREGLEGGGGGDRNYYRSFYSSIKTSFAFISKKT